MSLLLFVQSGDRISVAATIYTVLTDPLRLASPPATPVPLSEDDTPLTADVTVSIAGTPAASGFTLRFTAPRGVTITRIPGSAIQ
ncbi:hypothetical protein [Acidocella aromatica]|uniref:Uncharacterized protein n=1 Tax=Acidocella aromatica TaxID=1303579 RepID=A0A840VF85_9PROT|nr:hypothetical protein [Acidocella aromatica]MBB5374498.1 hypothetical protein [Acidocella aromatica]